MNSFFASVEQQLNPSLRGRPVGITAVEGETHGALVAASYEAKAFGVKTGTLVRDAKRMCPDIVFLPSRHRLYVRFNLRVAEVLDTMAELERIRSVDEFQLRMPSGTDNPTEGYALVRAMKARVAAEVGECLRFSAGLGPNPLLAKIAGKLEKPEGLRHLHRENMPAAISHLALDDLPGIARATKERLERAGVRTTTQLYDLDPHHARRIWGNIEGERFVRSLKGEDIGLVDTKRGGYGSSKVLAPECRNMRDAYLVSKWLIEKAAMRLRSDGRVASSFGLQVSFLEGGGWGRGIKCEATQATSDFIRHNRDLWRILWPMVRRQRPVSVSINLGNVGLLIDRTGDLLRPLKPGELSRVEKVSAALDQINMRFGAETIKIGVNRPHHGFFDRG